jgi:hypothetical protein
MKFKRVSHNKIVESCNYLIDFLNVGDITEFEGIYYQLTQIHGTEKRSMLCLWEKIDFDDIHS